MSKIQESTRFGYLSVRTSVGEREMLDLIERLKNIFDVTVQSSSFHYEYIQFQNPHDEPELFKRHSDRGELMVVAAAFSGIAGSGQWNLNVELDIGIVRCNASRGVSRQLVDRARDAVLGVLPKREPAQLEKQAERLAELLGAIEPQVQGLGGSSGILGLVSQVEGRLQETGQQMEKLHQLVTTAEVASAAATSLQEQTQSAAEGATKSREDLEDMKRNANAVVEHLLERKSKLADVEKWIEETRNRVRDLYTDTAGSSLRTIFKQRAANAEKERYYWLGATLALAAGLVGYAVYLGERDLTLDMLVARALVFLPALALEGFFLAQVRRCQLSEDEYGFRSAISGTFPAYKNEILEHVNEPEVAAFIRETVDRIYQAPGADARFSRKQEREVQQMAKVLTTLLDMGDEVGKAAATQVVQRILNPPPRQTKGDEG